MITKDAGCRVSSLATPHALLHCLLHFGCGLLKYWRFLLFPPHCQLDAPSTRRCILWLDEGYHPYCFFGLDIKEILNWGLCFHQNIYSGWNQVMFETCVDVDDDVVQPLRITCISLFSVSVFIQGIWDTHPLLDPFGGKNYCNTTYASLVLILR